MDVNVFFLHQISRRNSQFIRILLTQWLKSSLPVGYESLEISGPLENCKGVIKHYDGSVVLQRSCLWNIYL